ncbi:MAG: ATP-binding protein [Armatimonadota bacterium]|nr:ATP-binding protein [Armatimonadota bacterium]
MADIRELAPIELTHRCDPDSLGFETTAEITPLVGTVGQERAVWSIDFGLGIETQGFNLFVSGRTGTGRNSSVKSFVERKAAGEPVPDEWCYVNDFDDPYRPNAIAMTPGRGQLFAEEMDRLIDGCKNEIPRAFESENYEKRKSEAVEKIQKERDTLLTQLRHESAELGFSIEMTPVGIATVPMADGKPLSREEYEKLPDAKKEKIKERSEHLENLTNSILARLRQLEKDAAQRVKELDKEVALFAVGHLLDDLRKTFSECDEIQDYLKKVQDDIVEHLEDFRSQEKKVAIPGVEETQIGPSFDRYKVNVIVSNKDLKGAPVVVENNPTYYNLIGKIEYRARFGFMTTDHNMIKAGAIHRANGGYLIMQALDLLTNPFSWDALKRTLRAGEARIENIGEQYGIVPSSTLKPEPIPVKVKVILIGSPYIYHLLHAMDEDFRKLFKVKADFDIEMDRNDRHIAQYAAFIATRSKDRDLKPFHKTAVARIVDYGSRLIEDKEKLSTRFIEVSDIASEANYWASREGSELVTAEHVDTAMEQKEYRSKMIEDKVQRLIEEGTIMIDTDGAVAGQTNALSIYELGDHTFGRPSRITATVSLGRGGILDIQRETDMSGKIHNKGVMILSGYLAGQYGQDKPIVASVTLAFEQLYEELEGDSASSTELYTILSALSGVPIKQGIAVTGSVNQKGEIQPIGGVNRKIEGFYVVCKARELTGDQGVMIPIQNVKHLMLKQEVIDAVQEGKFHIWPVSHVNEGIEVLTGVPAGERLADGGYHEGTIHYMVEKRLRDFADKLKEFGQPDGLVRKARRKEEHRAFVEGEKNL